MNSASETPALPGEMIHVVVDCGAGFMSYTNQVKIISLEVHPGTSYIQAVALAGIPAEQVGFLSVNGTKKDKAAPVFDQDTIRPLPYIISG